MPQRIDVDPVRGLKEAIDELSTASASVERRIDSLGLRFEELGDLLDSDTIKKLDRYRSTQRTVSGLRGLVRDVDAYARAESMMMAHPGSWRNADEVIAWEGRLRERNGSLFRRRQSANDHIMRIKDPERWHGIELSRKYGTADALRILSAEDEAAEKEKLEDERGRWRERNRSLFRRHQSANDHIMRIKDPERWHGIELSRKYGTADALRILSAEDEAAEKEKLEDERSRWRERNRSLFRRHQSANDHIMRIKDPKRWHGIELSRKYGASDAFRILNAEEEAAEKEKLEDERSRWRERNRSLFRRHQSAIDEARGLRNPRAQHIIDLQRRYGSADAAMILDAERQAAVDEGAKRIARGRAEGAYNFRRDRWAKFQREYFDDTVRYGGGAEGRSMAEQERVRKSDLLRSRAMRMQQLNTYRKFPWMKTLVDAGIIEKKEIPKISKNLAKMSKAPIVGKFLQHPSLLPLAALGVSTALLERSDRANRVVQRWSASGAIYGTPSGRFDAAARLAGFESKEAVNKFFSQFVGEYGEASVDAVMTHIGAMLNAAKPGIQRDAILKAFKMDAQMGRAAMFMAGHRPKKSDETAARLGVLGDIETQGFSSDAGLFESLLSTLLWLPGVKSILARLGVNPEETTALVNAGKRVFAKHDPFSVYNDAEDLKDSLVHWMLTKPEKAKAAAESLEAVESAGNSISSVTNGGDTTVSFSIGNLEVNANDAQALAEELIKVGSGRSGLDIMEAFDRKEIA